MSWKMTLPTTCECCSGKCTANKDRFGNIYLPSLLNNVDNDTNSILSRNTFCSFCCKLEINPTLNSYRIWISTLFYSNIEDVAFIQISSLVYDSPTEQEESVSKTLGIRLIHIPKNPFLYYHVGKSFVCYIGGWPSMIVCWWLAVL